MAGRLPGGATTVRDIDWDALRLARSKVRGPATRITLQWLHGWLPLNEWLHTFDDKVPGHYCVSCKRLEDQDHLRRCPSRRDLVEQRLDCSRVTSLCTATTPLQHPATDLTWAHAARSLLSAHWSRQLHDEGLDGRRTCGNPPHATRNNSRALDGAERATTCSRRQRRGQSRETTFSPHSGTMVSNNATTNSISTICSVQELNARRKSIRFPFPRMMPTSLSHRKGRHLPQLQGNNKERGVQGGTPPGLGAHSANPSFGLQALHCVIIALLWRCGNAASRGIIDFISFFLIQPDDSTPTRPYMGSRCSRSTERELEPNVSRGRTGRTTRMWKDPQHVPSG